MTKKKTVGEVSAISGYDFQYEIFATEIYNCLLNNDVLWIEFASEDTGKLDDVLIGLEDRILAYQIKEISSSNFTYSQFTTSETESILQGAFKGWKKLKDNDLSIKVDARFITTQAVSENDSINSAIGKAKPTSEKFIRNFWLPMQNGKYTLDTLPIVWKPVMKELSDFVGEKPEDFLAFIKDFSFVFNYKLNNFSSDSYTQTKRENDIDKITKNIFRIVAKKGNIKYSKLEFIADFGLKNQLETHFQHSFFIDEKHYQPIKETITQLDRIVSTKTGGYLALVGNAGSGKSTLLTKWLADQDCKVLKYYAYTNDDMGYDFGFRGEAGLFLHDLLVQIRENKLSLQDRLPENDLLDLQKHFHQELKKLEKSSQNVFIIIDGLDHIDREQTVTKSLIEVLPAPKSIPANVYFILGTRTIDQLGKLSYEISEHLRETNAIVPIGPLTKPHILKLVESYQISLADASFELLSTNTKGHPLFLRYTLEELNVAEPIQYEAIVKANKFSGDIYKEYKKFWNKHKEYDDFIHLLALISRFRFPYFDIQLLRLFKISNADAEKIKTVAEFYFYKSENIWQFFHNSFKEFLIEQSSLDRFTGKPDISQNQAYHFEIAQAVGLSDSQYRFNQLYHLYKAARFTEVCQLASQEYFRQQWFEYRDVGIIFEDIKLASLASHLHKDQNILTVCFFSAFELEQRARNFQLKDYSNVFLKIGRFDIANSLVFNSARLLVDAAGVLAHAQALFDAGQKTVAKELFERAQPITLLNGSVVLSPRRYSQRDHMEHDEVKIVATWAVTASLFMPIQTVADILKSLEVEDDEHGRETSDPYSEGLSEIFDFYAKRKDWAKIAQLADIFDGEFDLEEQFYFYYELIGLVEKKQPLYERCLNFFETFQPGDDNKMIVRYLIVYAIIIKNLERCSPVLKFLKSPVAFKAELQSSSSDNGFSNYVFNYSRLYFIITKDFSVPATSFIPLNEKPAYNAFYGAFAELGKAYALMYHDYADASEGFFLGIENVFRVFHHSFLDPLHEYSISSEKANLAISILRVSSKMPDTTFLNVLKKVSSEWQNFSRFWRTAEIQNVIEWVAESGLDPSWCKSELKKLESLLFRSGYLDQRISDGIKQIEIWCALDEQLYGEQVMDKIMSVSLDVRGEKDSQLDYIVQWISKFEPIDHNEVQYYFDRLVSINEVVNSSSHTPARELLDVSLGLGNGFNVTSFLLFGSLVEFIDCYEFIFARLFKEKQQLRTICIKLFARIVLAMDNSHGNRQHFIYELFKNNPSSTEIKTLVKEINIYAITEVRNGYLYDLQQQCINHGIDPFTVGFEKKIEKRKDSGSSENSLRMISGESLTETDLLTEVKLLEDIIELQAKAEKHNYFKWRKLIKKVIPITADGELKTFLLSTDFDSQDLIEIGKDLIDNGQEVLAKTVLELALTKSRASGWVTIYDGGSKIKAFEQLKRIDQKNEFQQRALKDFSQSLTELDINAMEIMIKDLEQIFSLFFEDVDKNAIYRQIIDFRNELLKNHSINEKNISVVGDQDENNLFVDSMCFLITFPSEFSEIIFPLIIQHHQDFRDLVEQILSTLYKGGFYLKYLHLLAGLAIYDPDFIEKNQENLTALTSNKRFDISDLSERLLEQEDILLPSQPKSERSTVPLGYSLELAPKSGIVGSDRKPFDHIDNDGYLKDTQDPIIYTQLFKYEIAQIAKLTGFTKYNIANRIMQLGEDGGFPQWCASLSEERLRAMYDSTFYLKIAYKRPQIQMVIDGLNQVVKELYQLGLLEHEMAEDLSGRFDENIYLIDSQMRPITVASILSKGGSAPAADIKWAKGFDQAYIQSVLQIESEEDIILAENTTVSAMGHGRAVENRQSFIDLRKEMDNQGTIIFNRIYNCMVGEYPYQKEYGLTLYHSLSTVNSKESWLAINPELALHMGLQFNQHEGMFRWDDTEGNKVAESIFWQDGSATNKSSHHDSEAAEGWIVLISKEGMKKLIALTKGKTLYVHRKVERHMEFVQRRYNTYIKEEGIKTATETFNDSGL